MFSIFSNLNPKIKLEGNTLFENSTYYIIFDEPDDASVISFLSNESIKKHITWHPGNKVAEINICNYIGLIRLFDKEFDVRSTKFDVTLTGTQQVGAIVEELDNLSRKISFSYDSSIFTKIISDWDSVQDDYIHKLNYLYQIFFDVQYNLRVKFLFENVKRNPSLKYDFISKEKPVWKVKKITPCIAIELSKKGYVNGSNHSIRGDKISLHEQILSNDTADNQFVRFFFEYCQQICLRIFSIKKDLPEAVIQKSSKLLHECRLLLSDRFFSTVNLPSQINTNSTVLTTRRGYSELLKYYTNSLFSVKNIYEDYRDELKMDLVDIATLYEIWCFYKLAYQILGEHILVKEKTSTIKDGIIRYSTVFENQFYEVCYNKTFSVSNAGSYSTSLRPDISVLKKDLNELYHFDAKYRLNSYIGNEGSEYKTFKNDDISKMHAYLDAIYKTKSAIVLYPGTKFKFFVSQFPPKAIDQIESDYELRGVGALPLIPGTGNDFMKKLVSKYFD